MSFIGEWKQSSQHSFLYRLVLADFDSDLFFFFWSTEIVDFCNKLPKKKTRYCQCEPHIWKAP